MSESQLTRDEIVKFKETLSQVKNLETLEIYVDIDPPIHEVYKTTESPNIRDFCKFLDYQNEENFDRSSLNCQYKGMKYHFNRGSPLDECEGLYHFILIASDSSKNIKRGMVIISDISGCIFIGTCHLDALNQFNLDFSGALLE